MGQSVRPEQRSFTLAVDALLEFACESRFGKYRPARLEVADPALAEHLGGLLADTGIEVSVVERLDALRRALDDLQLHLGSGKRPLPGPLDGEGVTLERLQRFAEAAAAFYRAAPWQHLSDVDLIHIEEPKGPPEMRLAAVLGAARSVFGLAFYRTAADYYDFRRGAVRREAPKLGIGGLWQFSLNPITEIPFADADLWEDERLSVAGPAAYPLLVRFGPGRKVLRAGAAELSHAEAWLRALAATSETDIDSGRWHKDVTTRDGPVRATLAIPDLLKPPSHQTWVKRGFTPDRRAGERGFADISRFLAQHPGESVEEMNAVLERRFAGRSLDDLATQPEAPLERAQDLCYQAFSTHGRRRVQLARQALAISPDCADACVILAECAATLESQLDYYTRGVAAGERALGREAFEESVGHFWGVTETRPYMRARFGLAQTLEELGRLEEAISHYQELLRLNPEDNQGVRYLLMPRLMQLRRDVEAARLLKEYDEPTASWTYARALIAFRLSGRSAAAQSELRAAMRSNPLVPQFLLSQEEPPLPDTYSLGSVEEAILCAHELKPAFAASEGAMEWLAQSEARRDRERRKRKRRKGR
jgi:tetratricopeptide (TPR) repeat protein